jgi:hypothetical protein
MPTRKEVSKIKADFVATREKLVRENMSSYQLKLYDTLVSKYLKDIAGQQLTSQQSLKAITEVEKAIKNFAVDANSKILNDYVAAGRSLSDLNMSYFATMFDDTKKLDEIKQKTNQVLNKRLGLLPDGKVKPKGFIDKMITDSSIQKTIIKEVRKAITNNYDLNMLKETLKKVIVGSPESTGVFERHYNTFAKDILNTIDNANNKIYADELGLQHAIYAGGLIKTSRSLCLKNNGKIFTTDQIEALKNDPFIKKMYGDNIADYNPYETPGGYGCLHGWDWITKDLAVGKTREQNKKAADRNAAFKDRNNL